MEKILRGIAEILDFNDSFFEEVESIGKLGFYETDLVSGKFRASTNYRKLFNLPEKSIYGVEEYQEIVHPDDITWVIETFNTCKDKRRDFESEYRVIVKGEVRYFRGKSIFVLDERGEPTKVVGMKQDITDEKLAEIERQKYIKELEQAQELTTTIVHDLKAPIHNISMIAELLQGDVSEEKEKLIEVIEESCQRSYEIIDEVLGYSLTEEDSCEIAKEWQDIHKPINKAVSTLYYAAEKKGIKILTSLQPDTYAFIHPQKLQRAIENLLSNAVKFSHRNSHIEVSLHGKGDTVTIMIKDFGLGMNEYQKATLFDKENHLRRNGIDGEKSSGLGLNIVKKILHQHGGVVMVVSRESEGTTFYLEFPKE